MPELLLASGMLEVCYINLVKFLFFFFCFFSYKWFFNLHFLAANLFLQEIAGHLIMFQLLVKMQ